MKENELCRGRSNCIPKRKKAGFDGQSKFEIWEEGAASLACRCACVYMCVHTHVTQPSPEAPGNSMKYSGCFITLHNGNTVGVHDLGTCVPLTFGSL